MSLLTVDLTSGQPVRVAQNGFSVQRSTYTHVCRSTKESCVWLALYGYSTVYLRPYFLAEVHEVSCMLPVSSHAYSASVLLCTSSAR